MKEHKTLFAIRIGHNSPWHGLFALAKILTLVAIAFAALAGIQVKLCQDDFPERTIRECLNGIVINK